MRHNIIVTITVACEIRNVNQYGPVEYLNKEMDGEEPFCLLTTHPHFPSTPSKKWLASMSKPVVQKRTDRMASFFDRYKFGLR